MTSALLLLSLVVGWHAWRNRERHLLPGGWDRSTHDDHDPKLVREMVATTSQQAQGAMLLPFVVYVVLHFAVTLRVASPLPTYVSALWPPLYIICGVLLARGMRDYGMPRWSQIAFLLAAVTALAYQAYGSFVVPGRERQETPMIRAVNLLQASADTEQILVDQRFVPTLNYYLPDRRFPIFARGKLDGRNLRSKRRVRTAADSCTRETVMKSCEPGYPGISTSPYRSWEDAPPITR